MNILLIFPGFIIAFIIALYYKRKIRRIELKNKVHFYVARDLDGSLWIFIGKPFRNANIFDTRVPDCYIRLSLQDVFKYFGLNKNDYNNLKWKNKPVEVFLNMEN